MPRFHRVIKYDTHAHTRIIAIHNRIIAIHGSNVYEIPYLRHGGTNYELALLLTKLAVSLRPNPSRKRGTDSGAPIAIAAAVRLGGTTVDVGVAIGGAPTPRSLGGTTLLGTLGSTRGSDLRP